MSYKLELINSGSMIVGTSTDLEGHLGEEYVVYVQGNPDSPLIKGVFVARDNHQYSLAQLLIQAQGR